MRNVPGGQILCDACITAWQSMQPPFAGLQPPSGPNPSVAAGLGLIPGVGAMYNGQFVKGFVHVAIFAVLCSLAANVNDYFGFGIPIWIVYQAFEAYHTAKALRDGQPLPDPLGLNEVGNWLNLGSRSRTPSQPGAYPSNPAEPANPAGPAASGSPQPAQAPYQAQYQTQYQAPFTPPVADFTDSGLPPVPPVPPHCSHGREPIGAIVLIALGVLFLLNQFDLFHGRIFDFTWPILLIGLGVWLIIRRLGDSQGGCK
jgi:TM2 domain-containing membrane protein YozV